MTDLAAARLPLIFPFSIQFHVFLSSLRRSVDGIVKAV